MARGDFLVATRIVRLSIVDKKNTRQAGIFADRPGADKLGI
jgi:hypothetical protein